MKFRPARDAYTEKTEVGIRFTFELTDGTDIYIVMGDGPASEFLGRFYHSLRGRYIHEDIEDARLN